MAGSKEMWSRAGTAREWLTTLALVGIAAAALVMAFDGTADAAPTPTTFAECTLVQGAFFSPAVTSAKKHRAGEFKTVEMDGWTIVAMHSGDPILCR